MRAATVGLVFITALVFTPGAAQAVSFSGPTNFPVGSDPRSLAVGDFNGDSDPDLAVGNHGLSNVSILLGGAGGSFSGPTNFPVELGPRAVAVGDFNGDSDLDLAVTNNSSGNVSILLGSGNGSFTGPTNFSVELGPRAVAVGDLNGDSDLDLAVGSPNNVSILLGSGDGSFTGPTNYSVAVASNPHSVAVGDFNGDSDPDLAVAYANNISILLNAGDGSFTGPINFTAGTNLQSVAVGDFNGDSDLDLAVADANSDSVSILLGGAGGSFSGPTNFPVGSGPRSVALGDFNDDSDPDLAVANTDSNNVSILLGAAGGSFTGPTSFPAGSAPLSVAVGEFNGDFRSDLVAVSNGSDSVSILLNDDQQGYPRPKGATPLRTSLVVAYSKCYAPDMTHGPTLDSPSCGQPIPLSQYLTVGTPDANGRAANSVGAVRYGVISGNPATGADEADLRLQVSVTDVRGKTGLSDYIAELWATATVRLTDGLNPAPGTPATVSDFQFGWAVPCASTTETTIGSTCAISTTADALLPGSVPEKSRAIWQLGQVQVQDGGEDGEGSTTVDNTLFLKQGVFIP